MTEAMATVISFAKEKLSMTECVTSYAKANTASANVLHKLGFKDEKSVPYECGGDHAARGIMCRYISPVEGREKRKYWDDFRN